MQKQKIIVTAVSIVVLALLLLPTVSTERTIDSSRLASRNLLRVFIALMIYADHNEGLFPKNLSDIELSLGKDEKIRDFIRDPQFSYLASDLDTRTASKNRIVCTFGYPPHGRLVLYLNGYVEYKDFATQESKREAYQDG